jgi:hypothetical protein
MTMEKRLDQLEKRNKRLTVALTMMAVTMCAVVTMAVTGEKHGHFETVIARHIWVTNDAGDNVVTLGATDGGNGMIRRRSAEGKDLVILNSTANNNGAVMTYQPNGKTMVELITNDNGGMVGVKNKTGEIIVGIKADEYGNGVVWAGNRKGKGRTLQPGP